MKKFENYHFKGQHQDEQIITVVRRHWFNILQQFLLFFVMIFILVFALMIAPSFLGDFALSNFSNIFIFAESTIAMFVWLFMFFVWIDYYFDVWIITDKRIVNIEQKGLFSRSVGELEFSKIQDVSTEVRGVIPTILNYGEVHIQTAGATERFVFHKVPDPYHIKGLVMDLQKRHSQK
ncbi:MAG: hypothetical protein Athens071425_184 [Parcubacteria group bacterium Athens0714_25]|nr:MAG: hypothetical protein Athens071425_184 [Parcubacteria group bacterium Athens0714_25]